MKVWAVPYVSSGCIYEVEVFSSELEAEVFKRSITKRDDYDANDDDVDVYECEIDVMIRANWSIRAAVESDLGL